jgi:hypothetical protein
MNVSYINLESKKETDFENSITDEYVSPYKLAKVINTFITKSIPTQMIYNYCSKNLIQTEVIDSRNMIERSVAIEFITKFVTKRNSK